MGATSCASIIINDDTIFEDVEDFQAILITDPEVPEVELGVINTTLILIDDLGEFYQTWGW